VSAAEARHERTETWLSTGLLAALALCVRIEFGLGLFVLPLAVLTSWAHRARFYIVHVGALARWVRRIEARVDAILQTSQLLCWERTFVREQLRPTHPDGNAALWTVENLQLLASVAVFFVAAAGAPELIAKETHWSTALVALATSSLYSAGAAALAVSSWRLRRRNRTLDAKDAETLGAVMPLIGV